MTEPTRIPVGTRVSSAAEEALEATTHAIDSSRQLASETAGKIGETARDLRASATDLAKSGAESVVQATDAAQRSLGRFARTARRRVEEDPMKAVLIAAGVGAAVAALALVAFHTRHPAD